MKKLFLVIALVASSFTATAADPQKPTKPDAPFCVVKHGLGGVIDVTCF